MKHLKTLASLLLPVYVRAGSVRYPIQASIQTLDQNSRGSFQQQTPVHQSENSSPIHSVYFWPIYHINVSIGTPPQSFRLAIDLTATDVTVPSVHCGRYMTTCKDGFYRYNSSLSSSYQPGPDHSFHWYGVAYEGPLAYDNLHLPGFSLTSQAFQEWTSDTCVLIGCVNGGDEGGFDGVLGLGLPGSCNYIGCYPGVLQGLMDQGLKESSVFSIALPRIHGQDGELFLGGVNPDLFNGPLVELPLIEPDDSHPYIESSWTVSAEGISFNTSKPLEVKLRASSIAQIDTTCPYLVLPTKFANALNGIIGSSVGPILLTTYIPCSRRFELPNITFSLGPNSENFTITAFDYTHETDIFPNVGKTCIVSFLSAEFMWGADSDDLILGSPFLKGHYGVFDVESRKIGLAPLRH